VSALATVLPNVRFPVDVSGGVARFRHRHGELRLAEIELGAAALERWAAPRLRGIVGARAPDVWVRVRRAAATMCIAEVVEPDRAAGSPAPVVAFDLHALAQGEDLALVIAGARGADLPAPATAVAIACVEALLGGLADRSGCVFVVASPATRLARALWPEAGARAPSTTGVRWKAILADAATWILQAGRDEPEAAPDEEAVRAREVASALGRADDALARGALDEARDAYLLGLEHTPRHPEIVRRLIEIDARVPGRAEAALAALAELEASARSEAFGVTPGLLLLQRGDRDLALAALERQGRSEVAPALAAKALEAAARHARDDDSALRWLDLALGRAPRSSAARWMRVEKRLALGRLEEALGDVENLEALARGPKAKHAVWIRAGALWRGAGLAERAAPVFERALRFVPDEPSALAGLGVALLAAGQHARGVSLLRRALDVAEAKRRPATGIALDLAVGLAEKLDDLPSAIARAAAIAPDAAEAVLARGLEGRWRTRLGDVVGAGLAFARMRDGLFSHATLDGVDIRPCGPSAVDLLREAAQLEMDVRHDPPAAQRYLAEALRLRPHDPGIRAMYRAVGAAIAGTTPPDLVESAQPTVSSTALQVSPEARVEELTVRVRADPADDAAADELATLLERLDRGHELLALLSGRLEDASPERRARLTPKARATLERLAEQAAREGRSVEANLFRSAAEALVAGSAGDRRR
jgi:cellulose synthase operon protein C